MQSHVSATFTQLNCRGGVCIVDGYGASVRVARRQLVVSDGIGRFRRERIFAKALADIERLVILGHEGAITFEALRWLNDAGIAFLQIDRDGEIISSSAKFGRSDTRLRRALARARDDARGFEIAQFVLLEKLRGQESVLGHRGFPEEYREPLSAAIGNAEAAHSLEELLWAEASGAAAYWAAWRDIPMRFARKDEKRIPAHWQTFGQRSSPITSSPRLAANPGNALLNYLYAILEAETRIACLACGLDPGLGIFHTDQRSRDSLALDLMEAVRPQVDLYLLRLLRERTFTASDFVETRKGVCRVLSPVTHILAETRASWFRVIAPVVEEATRLLLNDRDSRSRDRIRTPLTQTNRSEGREGMRRGPKKTSAPAAVLGTCRTCGASVPEADRLFCDDCLPARRKEHAEEFSAAGPAALARLRKDGRDPTKTAEARQRQGRSMAERRQAQAKWEEEHEMPDPEVFTRKILPLLQGVSLGQVQKATGLSKKYCMLIKRGQVPHPMHWETLRRLS